MSCVPYVRERKQFGKPIGEFELVQGKLADMYVAMNASRAYVYSVAKACDRGQTTREDAAGAILYAAENATRVALDAIQLLGGSGYVNENPTGRFLRDAKLYEIGAGTSEIRRMLIGRELSTRAGMHASRYQSVILRWPSQAALEGRQRSCAIVAVILEARCARTSG